MSSVENTKTPKGAMRARKTERRHASTVSTLEQRLRSESPCVNGQIFEPSDDEELNMLRNARAKATEKTPAKQTATTNRKASPAPNTAKKVARTTVKKMKTLTKTPVQTKQLAKEPNPELVDAESDDEVDTEVVDEERNRPKIISMSADSTDAKLEPQPEKPKASKSNVKKGKKVAEPQSEPKLEEDANENCSEADTAGDSPSARKTKEVKSKADASKMKITDEGENKKLDSPKPESLEPISSDNVNGKKRKHGKSDGPKKEAEINGEPEDELSKEDDRIAKIKPVKTPAKAAAKIPRKTPAKVTKETSAKTLVKTPRKKSNASGDLAVVKAAQDADFGSGDESSSAAKKQRVSATPARERDPPITPKKTPARRTGADAAPPTTPKSPRRNARTKPKAPPRNPYLLFCASSPKDELLMKYPKMNKQDLAKNLGKMWKKMEADEDDTILQYEARLEALKSEHEKNIVLWENGQLNGKDEELE